ncbi:oxidative damage protection protein [Candidatus Erwinia haradaeae]|uniref:Probable Fe(2+)-trafficking protein n=1 Tax=Candidatus Erwinia haradaeae TaxID=1922217 RepID=A0A803FT05_9GAMM|nr:oxidative damage protection protein [Candidatus Erwinia haradaeae]VFP87400.1 Probable Fe(2+)-trafficking protein [Candidatus Erwinia haradaeae]
MSRIIFCTFLQRRAIGLDSKIYPGDIGKRIFTEISKEVWFRWVSKQTILINENKLNLFKKHDREVLEKEMVQFLFNRDSGLH